MRAMRLGRAKLIERAALAASRRLSRRFREGEVEVIGVFRPSPAAPFLAMRVRAPGCHPTYAKIQELREEGGLTIKAWADDGPLPWLSYDAASYEGDRPAAYARLAAWVRRKQDASLNQT
jgi:hypothetical protein